MKPHFPTCFSLQRERKALSKKSTQKRDTFYRKVPKKRHFLVPQKERRSLPLSPSRASELLGTDEREELQSPFYVKLVKRLSDGWSMNQ